MEKLKNLWKRMIAFKNSTSAMIAWLFSCVIPLLVYLKQLWKNATEYKIAVFALAVWLMFEAGGKYLGWQTYPVGYWQKLSFGIVSIIIIMTVAWLWMEKTFPALKALIDPDKFNTENISKWQSLKLAALFFCLFVFCTVLLVSLY